MDLEQASASIDALIARRAGERNAANELQAMYAESARRHRERKRRQNGAAWFEFYSRLAANHARISDDFERRAAALLEDEEGGDKWGA